MKLLSRQAEIRHALYPLLSHNVQAMHTEDAIDDADLAAPPAPPVTRSLTQSFQVPLPATPSVPPATSAEDAGST
jgi:hypothetical protein